jgi:hypothetical protein
LFLLILSVYEGIEELKEEKEEEEDIAAGR